MKHIKKFNEDGTDVKDFVGAPFFVPSHHKTEYVKEEKNLRNSQKMDFSS
jgi:hypothetical protein